MPPRTNCDLAYKLARHSEGSDAEQVIPAAQGRAAHEQSSAEAMGGGAGGAHAGLVPGERGGQVAGALPMRPQCRGVSSIRMTRS